MQEDATDQVATLDFALEALQGQIVVLQDEQMEIVSNCDPWTVRRLASHALNNQLFWAGTVTREDTVSFEATMGAEPYGGDVGQFAGEVARRALDMWSTDGVFDYRRPQLTPPPPNTSWPWRVAPFLAELEKGPERLMATARTAGA